MELSNPSLPGYGIDEAYQVSDQRHWTVRCSECGALHIGFQTDQAVIRVGDTEVSGSLSIAHVTKGFSLGTICGANFSPATPFDEKKLATLMERLTAGTK